MTWAEQESAICDAIEETQTCVLVHQNLHGIYTYLTDERFRELHDNPKTIVQIDGMFVVWLGRLIGLPVEPHHRTAWTDYLGPLLQIVEKNSWRVYYVGGETKAFCQSLYGVRRRFPSLDIQGHPGYFDAAADSADNREILRAVSAFDPHLILVGMGMGRQERWVLGNLDEIRGRVVIACGNGLHYLGGVDAPPPRWTGRVGLEWFIRFLREPQRLWKRYLVEPWIIAWMVLVNRVS